MRGLKRVLAFAALMLLAASAAAQVKLAYVGEISGQLAVSGGNFRDGIILAVEEINARGGMLKQKLDLTLYDTQTNPGVARAQMQKAIDGEPYVIFGPVLSGNVKVTLEIVKQAEVPQFIGGEAADLITLGNPKTMLFYVALVPTLVDLGSIGLRDYGMLLAATFVVLLAVLVPYIALASRARLLLKQPKALQRLNRVAAGILAGTAAYIATRAA